MNIHKKTEKKIENIKGKINMLFEENKKICYKCFMISCLAF